MNYWKRFPGDYGRDTSHLTIAQHGAYALLLDVYYSTEKPLPADISVLSRICRATTPDEQAAVKAVAEEFFPIGDDGKRHNGRADRQLEKDRAFAESQAQKARLPRKNSQKLAGANPGLSPGCSQAEPQLSPPVPVPVPVPVPPPNPSPTPKPPQEKEMDTCEKSSPATKRQPQLKRPDDVSEDTWNGFVSLRRAKKAPISDAALKGIRREADKARVSMDEALQTCCARGWTGFKADWMHEDRGGGQRVNGNTAPNSYVGLSQKDYGKTRMGGFLERQMKAKLNGGDK